MMMFDVAAKALRQLDPETAHGLTIRALKKAPLGALTVRDDPVLKTTLRHSGLTLANPIGLAAGFDKNAEVFRQMLALGFGFVECGTVTPRPQPGNPRPRLFRLSEDNAVINRMGFNNDGLGAYCARLGRHRRRTGPVGANVGANKDADDRIADYVTGYAAVHPLADYVTINISSPNTPGLRGLQDRSALEDLLGRCGETAKALNQQRRVPAFLKLAPDLDDTAIDDICDVVLRETDWLTGLVVSNTTSARPDTLTSSSREQEGGLSGAPLFEPSTEVLAAFADRVSDRFDLIGAGGISTVDHVLAKFRAGASAVQLYSALVYEGPSLVRRLKRELVRVLKSGEHPALSEAHT